MRIGRVDMLLCGVQHLLGQFAELCAVQLVRWCHLHGLQIAWRISTGRMALNPLRPLAPSLPNGTPASCVECGYPGAWYLAALHVLRSRTKRCAACDCCLKTPGAHSVLHEPIHQSPRRRDSGCVVRLPTHVATVEARSCGANSSTGMLDRVRRTLCSILHLQDCTGLLDGGSDR